MIGRRGTVYVGVASGMLAVLAVGLWLLLAQGEPAVEVSAAQALQQACDTMAESDYDKTTVETTDVDRVTSTWAISGNDARTELFYYDLREEGEPLLQELEIVTKDGVAYARHRDPDAVWTEWLIWKTDLRGDLALPCFGADTSAAGRSASIEGSSNPSERRIVWKTEETYDGITLQHVLSVDANGRPVRGQIIEVPSSAEASAGSGASAASGTASSDGGSSSGGKVVLDETYSGFGDPNIITAPIATPTPAPTPTPWPFISLPNTMLEALFYPISSGDAVGYFGTANTLRPTTFRTGDVTTTVQLLKWQDSAVTLGLSPYNALAGQKVDFITGDGTTSLSLEASAATGDSTAGTLTWAVGSQPWSSGDELMLRIRDANTPPAFAQDAYTFSVPESKGLWEVIATVKATDQDGDAVLHKITSGRDGGRFSIDGWEGWILLMRALDYETKSSYELTVTGTDPGGRSATTTVTINVTDVAE